MNIQTGRLDALKLPAMGQLGIIVKSIDRSLPYYRDVMKIRPWYSANVVEEEIYYFELIQTTLFGVNVGMSRFMIKLGNLLGDIAVI